VAEHPNPVRPVVLLVRLANTELVWPAKIARPGGIKRNKTKPTVFNVVLVLMWMERKCARLNPKPGLLNAMLVI
jgi:transposase